MELGHVNKNILKLASEIFTAQMGGDAMLEAKAHKANLPFLRSRVQLLIVPQEKGIS